MSNSGSVWCMTDMHKVRARHSILQSSRVIEDEPDEAGDTDVQRKSTRFPPGKPQVPTSDLLDCTFTSQIVSQRRGETISEIRGVFPNPLHTTCHLGSLLHCLLSLHSVAEICVQHATVKKNCPNTCFLCLLQEAYN